MLKRLVVVHYEDNLFSSLFENAQTIAHEKISAVDWALRRHEFGEICNDFSPLQAGDSLVVLLKTSTSDNCTYFDVYTVLS